MLREMFSLVSGTRQRENIPFLILAEFNIFYRIGSSYAIIIFNFDRCMTVERIPTGRTPSEPQS
jgi:hypothetical protein